MRRPHCMPMDSNYRICLCQAVVRITIENTLGTNPLVQVEAFGGVVVFGDVKVIVFLINFFASLK